MIWRARSSGVGIPGAVLAGLEMKSREKQPGGAGLPNADPLRRTETLKR